MGSARRWKRKQAATGNEYRRPIGPSKLYEGGNVSVVLDIDVDGVALGWQCKKCGAGSSTLLPAGMDSAEVSSSILTDLSNEHQNCERQSTSELPASVGEAFQILRGVFDAALGNCRQTGPLAIIIGTNTCFECPPFSDETEKQISLSFFRAGCRALLADNSESIGVAIGIEGWQSSNPSLRPSLDPERTECVNLLGLTDVGVFFRQYSIQRRDGKPGEGPGSLGELVSPSAEMFFAPSFQTCAARPFLRLGQNQLMS